MIISGKKHNNQTAAREGDRGEDALILLVQLHAPRQKKNDTEGKKVEKIWWQRDFQAYSTQQSNGGADRGGLATRDATITRHSIE